MQVIKINRELAERLVLLAAYMARGGYDSPYTAIRSAYEEGDWKHRTGELFPELSRNGYSSMKNLTFAEMVDQGVDALMSSASESHFPQLVSTIVDLLQQPYCQNVMAGDTLRRLRKAVLFPEELAKVSANANKELKCGNCGKPLVNGEMVTFMEDGRMTTFVCSRCQPPSYAACHQTSCEHVAPIDARVLAKSLSKTDCGMHDGKKPTPEIPQEIRVGRAQGRAGGGLRMPEDRHIFQAAIPREPRAGIIRDPAPQVQRNPFGPDGDLLIFDENRPVRVEE